MWMFYFTTAIAKSGDQRAVIHNQNDSNQILLEVIIIHVKHKTFVLIHVDELWMYWSYGNMQYQAQVGSIHTYDWQLPLPFPPPAVRLYLDTSVLAVGLPTLPYIDPIIIQYQPPTGPLTTDTMAISLLWGSRQVTLRWYLFTYFLWSHWDYIFVWSET